jgi:hypothetical protein
MVTNPLKNKSGSRFNVALPLVGDAERGLRRPQGATLQFFNGLLTESSTGTERA